MRISLSPETERLIEERMKRGGHPTADDVVRAGLALLEQQAAEGDFEPGEWDRLIAEAEASGEPLDREKVFAELRALRARHGGKAG
jgi:Arc/MetJ-type ribon-helix-helix transcriptional regulator